MCHLNLSVNSLVLSVGPISITLHIITALPYFVSRKVQLSVHPLTPAVDLEVYKNDGVDLTNPLLPFYN